MKRIACLIVLSAAGALIGVGHLEWFRGTPEPGTLKAPSLSAIGAPVPQAPVTLADVRRQASGRARPHLDEADRECEQVVAEHLRDLERFFASAKRRTPDFADAALGWSSKWRLVADRLPFTRTDRQDTFLREAFEKHLFTSRQLEQQVRQVVRNYLTAVGGIENLMLVKIRTDIADLPPLLLVARMDDAQFRDIYRAALEHAADRTGASLRDDVVQQVITLVVGEVLTQAAIRVGVSAGILGAGAASSTVTLGIGLVVGLIIDQIVSWVWDWWADPRGNLAREMDRKLDELHQAIVDGSPSAPGLRLRLGQFARERAAVRRAVVLDLLQKAGGAQ